MPQDPPPPSPLPTALPSVEIDVPLEPGGPLVPLRLPARSPEEAFAMLITMGEGLEGGGITGAGARNLYYGSVLEPIRDAYKVRLESVEREVLRRRALLGPTPDPLELRGLAQWAARQRARTAHVARLPTPSLLAGLEARDWREYGPGGRTFENLMRRKLTRQNLTGAAAYESILNSASTSNPKVNASISRAARHLRVGGGVLGAVGLAFTAHDIVAAPPEQRGEVATRAAVSFAGGLIGSEVAVGLVTVGAALLLGVTPAGWVILGVGLVGGIIGGMIAERVFYPPQAEPVAREIGLGIAVDPNRPGITGPTDARTGALTAPGLTTGEPQGMAPTLLPIIRQVPVTIRAGDTQLSITQRATRLAAASVGLPPEVQQAFMTRHSSATGLRWMSGDPTPGSQSSVVSARDVALTAGREVIYELNDSQRAELTELVGR